MLRPRLLRCSFCGKDETQVSKLVAGPKAYICDACVAAARQIMENSSDARRHRRRNARSGARPWVEHGESSAVSR